MYNLTIDFLYRRLVLVNPSLEAPLDYLYVSEPTPRPVDYAGGTGNTLLRFTPKFAPRLSMSAVITYNRVDFDLFMRARRRRLPAPLECQTAHDLVPYFLKETDVLFEPQDIEDTPIDRTDPDNVTVQIIPTESSLSWLPGTGSLIRVTVGPSDVDKVLAIKDLSGLTYGTDGVVYADVYLSSVSFDHHQAELNKPDLTPERLAKILTACTGDIWEHDVPAYYSIKGATITQLSAGQYAILLSVDCWVVSGTLTIGKAMTGEEL